MAYKVEYTYKLIDELTGPLNTITAAISRVQKEAGLLITRLAEIQKIQQSVNTTQARWNTSLGNTQKSLNATAGRVTGLTADVKALGMGLATNATEAQAFRSALTGVASATGNVATGAAKARAEVGLLGMAMKGAHTLLDTFFYGTFAAQMIGGAAGALLKPGMNYQHQQNAMAMGGMTPDEIANANVAAQSNIKTTPMIGIGENLERIRELRSIMGTAGSAIMSLPIVNKLETILRAAEGTTPELAGKSHGMAFAAAKAAERLGRANTPEELEKFTTILAKEAILTAGRVTPQKYQTTLAMMRAASYGKSDEFLGPVLGHFIQEYSASGSSSGSKGVGPGFQAFYRMFQQGIATKTAAQSMINLGLVQGGGKLSTQTINTMLTGTMKDRRGLIENPVQWIWETLKPALEKRAKVSFDQVLKDAGGDPAKAQARIIDILTKNFTGLGAQLGSLVAETIVGEKNIRRQIMLYNKLKSAQELFNDAMQDVGVQVIALHTAITNLGTALGADKPLIAALSEGLQSFTARINDMAVALAGNPLSKQFEEFIKKYPDVAKGYQALYDTIKVVTPAVINSVASALRDLFLVIGTVGASLERLGVLGTMRLLADTIQSFDDDPKVAAAAKARMKADAVAASPTLAFGAGAMTGPFAIIAAPVLGGAAYLSKNLYNEALADELNPRRSQVFEKAFLKPEAVKEDKHITFDFNHHLTVSASGSLADFAKQIGDEAVKGIKGSTFTNQLWDVLRQTESTPSLSTGSNRGTPAGAK